MVTSLSDVAIKNDYVKPEVFEGFSLDIKGGRHPIVEKLVGPGEFVKMTYC